MKVVFNNFSKLGISLLLLVLCVSNIMHASGQFTQGGYDSYRSNQVDFATSHAQWFSKVSIPDNGKVDVTETVVDSVHGKAYSPCLLKQNFGLLQVDLTSGNFSFINISIPHLEKYGSFNKFIGARLDSERNYYVTYVAYLAVVKVSNINVNNVNSAVLSETHKLYIIASDNSISALDTTSLSVKWAAKVYASSMIVVNSEIKGFDIIYASGSNELYKILARTGRIMSTFQYPEERTIGTISYVNGVKGWVSVIYSNYTSSVGVSLVNIDEQIESGIEVMHDNRLPFVDNEDECSYPMANAIQNGRFYDFTVVAKCRVSGGSQYSQIFAIKTRYNSNDSTNKALQAPEVMWAIETPLNSILAAKVSSKTVLSLENNHYVEYDIYNGKPVNVMQSPIPMNDYSSSYLITGLNSKLYRYTLNSNIEMESVSL